MATPEDRINEAPPPRRSGGHDPVTDPIDIQYKLGDQVQKELAIVRLETAAAIHRALAEGFSKSAQIMGGTGVGNPGTSGKS
jgi:hypothetical protein